MSASRAPRVALTAVQAVACAAFLSLAMAANDAPTAPTRNVPYSQFDLRTGTGATAVSGSTATVNYTGWLYDASKPDNKGLQFDSSIGATPFAFTIGVGQV